MTEDKKKLLKTIGYRLLITLMAITVLFLVADKLYTPKVSVETTDFYLNNVVRTYSTLSSIGDTVYLCDYEDGTSNYETIKVSMTLAVFSSLEGDMKELEKLKPTSDEWVDKIENSGYLLVKNNNTYTLIKSDKAE